MPVIFQSSLLMAPTNVLVITTYTLPSGVQNSYYSIQLMATGGVPPYTWSFDSVHGTLPAGVRLGTTGLLSGTPTNYGSFNFACYLKDSRGLQIYSNNFTPILITQQVIPVSIVTATPLPNETQYTAYSVTLIATGGTSPYTWSISSGALPSNVTLSSTGIISGTPTSTGAYSVVIKVTDVNNATASKNFTGSILVAPPLTIVTTSPLPSVTVGNPYSYNLIATGGLPPYSWEISDDGTFTQNNWILEANGQLISNPVPTIADTEVFLFGVTDAAFNFQDRTFDLVVNPIGPVPGAPTNIATTPGNGLAYVSWTAPVDGPNVPAITGYIIETSDSLHQANVYASPGSLTGLTNGTFYQIAVAAVNSNGTGAFSTYSSVTPTSGLRPPGFAVNVNASAGQQSATVSWGNPTDTGGSAIISASIYSSNYANDGIALLNTGNDPATINNVPGNITYQFYVVVNNSTGSSVPSELSNAVTPTVPSLTPRQSFLSYCAMLKSQGKIMVGQHIQYYEGDTNSESEAYTSITPLYSQTGHLPAIIGVAANNSDGGGGQPSLATTKQIITDWCSTSANQYKPLPGAGVVQVIWGCDNPTGGGQGDSISSSQLASLITIGSSYYNNLQGQITTLRNWLLSVVAANPNVVLIVRLFAEINLTGEWWYAVQNNQTDVDNQVTLQQQVFNSIFSGNSLRNNVLIIYNANNFGGINAWAAWPGNSYADMAGIDIYDYPTPPQPGDSSWQTGDLAPGNYSNFTGFGVPLLHCEVGAGSFDSSGAPSADPIYTVDNLIIPTALHTMQPAVIGYVQFNDNGQGPNNSFSITLQSNASELMNTSYIVTLSALPSF